MHLDNDVSWIDPVNWLAKDKHMASPTHTVCPIRCACNRTWKRFDGKLAEICTSSELNPRSFPKCTWQKFKEGLTELDASSKSYPTSFARAHFAKNLMGSQSSPDQAPNLTQEVFLSVLGKNSGKGQLSYKRALNLFPQVLPQHICQRFDEKLAELCGNSKLNPKSFPKCTWQKQKEGQLNSTRALPLAPQALLENAMSEICRCTFCQK